MGESDKNKEPIGAIIDDWSTGDVKYTGMPNSKSLVETLKSLFGEASPAPMVGGGDSGFQIAPHVVTGPPQVATPGPGQQSGGALPQTPPGVPGAQPSAQPMPQSEFRTTQGARGAIATSAISDIANTLQRTANQKKEENIQHAQFLYSMLKSAYESGDQQTANFILQDPKNQKLIEKFLTGALPRVPGKPEREVPLYGPRTPGSQEMRQTGSVDLPARPGDYSPINKPGGVAMPRATTSQQIGDIVKATMLQRLRSGDPQAIEQALGPGSSLSKEDYQKATKAAFGIELSPAQVQAMDTRTQQLLITAKSQVLQELIQQQGAYSRAMGVAGLNDKMRRDIAAQTNASRERIASAYRDTMKAIRGTAPDKMNQVLWKSVGDMNKAFSVALQKSADAAEKAGNKDLANTLRTQATDWAQRGAKIYDDYQNQLEIDDIINRATQDIDDEGGVISDEPVDKVPD